MAVTVESYVQSDANVQSARKKLEQISAEYSQLQGALVPPGAGKTAEQVKTRLDKLKKEVNNAKKAVAAAEQKATAYFNKNKSTIIKQEEQKQESSARAKLEEAKRSRDILVSSNQPTSQLDAVIADLEARVSKTGQYAPPAPKAKEGKAPAAVAPFNLQTYSAEVNKLVANAGKTIAIMTPEQRLSLSQQLKDAGYLNAATGNYSPELINAYATALTDTITRSTDFNREYNLKELLAAKKLELAGIPTSGVGGPKKTTYTEIGVSDPTDIQRTANTVYQSLLGRDLDPKEVASIVKKVQTIQRNNPPKTIVEPDANGNQIRRTIPGPDIVQVITDVAKGLPEFKQRRADERNLILQSLQETAVANGLDLNTNFNPKTVDAWVTRIQNGEKEDIFSNLIRQTAKVGLPDSVKQMLDNGIDLQTIYSPYRSMMASTLEVNPAAIQLNDPTLRMAIGPDKEMSLYEYQRQLRQDPRWQYTNRAREEVSSAALKVLKDFGFQG